MGKRKVLVINTVEFVMGGISSVIMNYFENMDKNKIQMDFVVNKWIEPYFEDIMKNNYSKIFILNRNENPLKYILQLKKIIKENKYNVVHVHGNSATMTVDLLAAILAGTEVRIAHSHNSECKHVMIHKMLSPLFHFTYTKALACSKEAGDWIFGKNKFDVLPNGIEVAKYKFSEEVRKQVRKELGLENKIILGHVGFMNEQKNHPKLFEIFAEVKRKIPNAHLLCVTGSDGIPRNLQTLINQYHIEKDITVLFKRNDVNRLMQAMDVFVLPSKWEGLPMVLVEAQATGLQCLVSKNVSSESNITGNVKYLQLESCSKDWCNEVISILKNTSRNSGTNIDNTIFNLQNSCCKLEEIFDCS